MRRLCLHKNGLQAHTTGKPLGLAKKCLNACACTARRERTFGLVKECLGWHSECYTRRVPTRRISITHRTNLARRRPKYNRTYSNIAPKHKKKSSHSGRFLSFYLHMSDFCCVPHRVRRLSIRHVWRIKRNKRKKNQ